MSPLAGVLSRRRSPTTTVLLHRRSKTSSAQHVASRHIDPTFEKLMEGYKHLYKVIPIQDLILASPSLCLPLPLLSSAAQRLRLNRGAAHFLRSFPHVFSLSHSLVRLSPAAAAISRQESAAAASSASAAASRLRRLLSISPSRSLPLRAVFKVWRELGLPDDFEESVLAQNPNLFSLFPNPREPNTHLLHLLSPSQHTNFTLTPDVEEWRSKSGTEVGFSFNLQFPPGMRLAKDFRKKLKEWQRIPYNGPYEVGGRRSKEAMEKRAVGIAHEFLSLTVEKMAEVEKVSQFRKWFGIEMNVRDLFLDHPGIFYLSTKGKRHTVFLREAYIGGRLIEPNPIYDARRQLLDLVLLRQRGMDRMEMAERGILGILGVDDDDNDDDDDE